MPDDLRRANRLLVAERCGWPEGALEECDRLEQVHATWTAEWPDDEGGTEPDRRHPGWAINWMNPRSGAAYSAGWRGDDRVRAIRHDGLPHGRPWALAATPVELTERMTEIERHIIAERVLGARLGRW